MDLSTISRVCKTLKGEVGDGDLVALLHSVFVNQYNGNHVSYGIYAAVLLARESDAAPLN